MLPETRFLTLTMNALLVTLEKLWFQCGRFGHDVSRCVRTIAQANNVEQFDTVSHKTSVGQHFQLMEVDHSPSLIQSPQSQPEALLCFFHAQDSDWSLPSMEKVPWMALKSTSCIMHLVESYRGSQLVSPYPYFLEIFERSQCNKLVSSSMAKERKKKPATLSQA